MSKHETESTNKAPRRRRRSMFSGYSPAELFMALVGVAVLVLIVGMIVTAIAS